MQKPKVAIPISQVCIDAFANESEVINIDSLSIENRIDKIQIHGSIDITRDKVGLENILAIKRQIDTIANKLKSEDLPDRIEVLDAKSVSNPFE